MYHTMDATIVRAEIKSWERAFKTEKQRDPTVDDIKAHPKIAMKYKLYKKLSKESSLSPVPKEAIRSVPLTPPRRPSALPGASSLVPKSRAIAHRSTDATPNPFSPAKSPRRKLIVINEEPLDTPNFLNPPTTPPSKKRAYCAPSPESFPSIKTAPEATSSFVNSVIDKARKRLRGDTVSPSPKKLRKSSARHSPGLQSDSEDDSKPDASYIDDSPVKTTTNGKDFKLLFEEERLPRPDFSSTKGPFSRSKSVFAPFDRRTSEVTSRPLPEERENQRKKVSLQSRNKALPSVKTVTKSFSSGKQPYAAMKSTIGDIHSSADNDEVYDTGPSRISRKRSSSMDANDLATGDQSASATHGGLLPPSPPPSSATQSGVRGISGKGQTKNRKRAKLIAAVDIDEDSMDEQELQIVDFDLRSQRLIISLNVGDEEDDTTREAFGSAGKDHYDGVSEVRDDGSESGEPEVSLPEDLRKVLYISSSRARAREERDLVDSLLQGRPGPLDHRGEVWGIGEIEDATATITDGEDDWAGEGIPWEVGEL